MKIKNQNQKGFTLIELLVVISIISLLSSVVLSSLRTARLKAKDTTIKTQVNQWATLQALDFSERGSYSYLSSGWIPNGANLCSSSYSSSVYVNKAREICEVILNNSNPGGGVTRIYSSVSASVDCVGCNTTTHWSIMVRLNSGGWYCMGSSLRKGEYPTTYENQPGCYNNP